MSITQDQLDALDLAIVSGELQVRHGDTMVTYRSLDELLKARAFAASQLQSVPRRTIGIVRNKFRYPGGNF